MKDTEEDFDNYQKSINYFRKLEKSVAEYLGLPKLRTGGITIRNEKGWRENEKSIEYIWIVEMALSFVGWGGLFAIKYNENKFREHENKEEIVHGVFISNDNGAEHFYSEITLDTKHEVAKFFSLNLIDANGGITLDGVSYNVRIIARNINTFIHVNNPNSNDWKIWEKEIWERARSLAKNSNNIALKNLFDRD